MTDLAEWRPANGTWYIAPSNGSTRYAVQWGLPGDVPVVGDFDGDGKADVTIWRPLNQSDYIIPSTQPSTSVVMQWGLTGDAEIYSQPPRTGVAITSISNNSPIPLTPLYIGTSGLNTNAPLILQFTNSSGFSLTEQPIRIGSDGTVVVAVPIYVDALADR